MGEEYYKVTFDCFWVAGQVILAGDEAGQDMFATDDAISLEIVRPDGSKTSWGFDFSNECTAIAESPPVDVSAYFKPGINKVTVRLNDKCGTAEGNAPLYFSTTFHPDPQADNTAPQAAAQMPSEIALTP